MTEKNHFASLIFLKLRVQSEENNSDKMGTSKTKLMYKVSLEREISSR